MNRRNGSLLLLTLAAAFLWAANAYAYMKTTHRAINIRVIRNGAGGFNLDEYLRNRLLFDSGVDEVLATNKILDTIRNGGAWEDVPDRGVCIPEIGRAINHYHNPLTDNGYSLGGILLGDSIIKWAQKPRGQQQTGVLA
jgi:hypothetical protein